MPVFFRIRPVAIAVFKIDAKVLDWFALKFPLHARIICMGQPGGFVLFANRIRICFETMSKARCIVQNVWQLFRPRQTQHAREDHEIRRVFLQGAFGDLSQTSG